MSLMLIAMALLVVALLVVAAIVVVVVVLARRSRRSPARYDGPVAAPGAGEVRAEASGLVLLLDDEVGRSRTTLDLARLQLGDDAVGELARAVDEGSAARDELSRAVAQTQGASTQGPASTAAAGQLAAAVARGHRARASLGTAGERVAAASRRVGPPPPA